MLLLPERCRLQFRVDLHEFFEYAPENVCSVRRVLQDKFSTFCRISTPIVLSHKIGVVIPKGVDDVGDYNRTRRVYFGIKLSFTVLPRSGFSETLLELYREILQQQLLTKFCRIYAATNAARSGLDIELPELL